MSALGLRVFDRAAPAVAREIFLEWQNLAMALSEAKKCLDLGLDQHRSLQSKGLIRPDTPFLETRDELALRDQLTELSDWAFIQVPIALRKGVRGALAELDSWNRGPQFLERQAKSALTRSDAGAVTTVIPATGIEVVVVDECDVRGRPGLVDLTIEPTLNGWARIEELRRETLDFEVRLADEGLRPYWDEYLLMLSRKLNRARALEKSARELLGQWYWEVDKVTDYFVRRWKV